MKRSLLVIMLALSVSCTVYAKGSFSSGGSHSYSSASSSKGSFSSTSPKSQYIPYRNHPSTVHEWPVGSN